MLPDIGTSAEFTFSRVPVFPGLRKPGKRIIAIYLASASIGFAAAWFGAATFDQVNLKIDSYKDRLDIVPYK
ncbi:Essential MCU regulator, mitochondrial [Caenorhabditis elegans]|nr:Essential MCU regulator, mitochondrial [Caenorhabditis elegans]CAR64655.1 Essential MCU regulator, mitochondrial [Caenorhabditis elegans]|eukprot:NP_001129879.1 Uncharacterized protein CELE_C15H11.11 [Caenorhabditis elegans]